MEVRQDVGPGETHVKASDVVLRFWGVRGSVPTPGPTTSRYGGNTSCVEVARGGKRLIFDAGTGLRLLGTALAGQDAPKTQRIFLTHFHWDHIQGFPFFAPLYDPSFRLEIVGPEQDEIDIRTLFASQMGPVYFPVPFDAVAARTSFVHLNEGEWEADGFRVRAMRMRHPSFTLGYRIEVGGKVLCYLPDNELEGGSYPVDGGSWRERLGDFVRDADVLVHDAMYTDEEHAARQGWGHSTFEQAFHLARTHGVRRLLFFHHAPERSDAELDGVVDAFRERASREDGPGIGAAREENGLTLTPEDP